MKVSRLPDEDSIKRVLDNAIRSQLTEHYAAEVRKELEAKIETMMPRIVETIEENLKDFTLANARIMHDMYSMQDKLLVAYAFNPEADKPIECEEIGEIG